MTILSKSRLCAAIVASLMLVSPGAQAQDKGSFSEEQKQEIRTIVKDYLVQNPKVLYDALVELERHQNELQQASARDALKEVHAVVATSTNNIVVGNPKGDITMVEFFDYNCGYCKRALGDVKSLAKSDGQLRIVLRDFPVLGPESTEASKVSLAVMRQLDAQKMFDYHSTLLETRGRVNGERAKQVAKDMGVDMAKLEKDLTSAEIDEALKENLQIGEKLSLNGTPAFIIGDEIIPGAVGLDPLRLTVTNVRKCGKASC